MKTSADIIGSNYGQKLSNPLWKDFAREMRDKKGNCCENCKRGNLPLQVHHLFYDPSLQPWEHDPSDVIVLCESCHSEIHEQLKKFRRHVFRFLNGRCFQVLNGALAVGLTQHDPLTFCHALAEFASSPMSVERFAKCWKEATA